MLEQLNSLNAKKQKLRVRIDGLYLDKIDGKISEEFWQERHNNWTQSLITVQNNINAYETANIDFIGEGSRFLKICKEIKELYLYGNNKERKELINYVLQNLTLDGEKLSYTYKNPLTYLPKD